MNPKKLHQAQEALVVGLARTGDRQAFAELVRRRQQWLRTLFRRLSADPELADDLAQQTLLQAYNNIARLKEPRKFPGWLKTTALNVWRSHWRAHPEVTTNHEQDEYAHTMTADLRHDLEQALATLAVEPRTCVVLAYHEGMSHDEISQALNLPLGTVKSHIRRGSEKLKSLLSAYAAQQPTQKSDPVDQS